MPKNNFWFPAIAGLCAMFIGLGLCRFAYTPLIPALITHHWVTKAGAGYLGTINFVGYLLGAFSSRYLSRYKKLSACVKISMLVSIVGLATCAINLGFVWLAIWRFAVGVTGGILMVLTPSVILANTPKQYKGRVSGLIFTGVGVGIVVSGFVVPPLANMSLAMA
jgi:MFS family permease